MTRINDNPRSADDQREAIKQMALRVNQLERLLDQKELYEAKVENGKVYYRKLTLSLNAGLRKDNWVSQALSTADTVGATKYMVYQITDDGTVPPTADFDWVRAHA